MYFIQQISSSAKVILKDNYATLNFTSQLRKVLDENPVPLSGDAAFEFNRNLVFQEHNITEKGEKEATAKVRAAYSRISKASTPASNIAAVREIFKHLRTIEQINMHAIVRKNDVAQASVNRATITLGLAGTFAFLVLFSFSVNFPGILLDPLQKLVKGIREISNRNFKQRIHFDENDEFAELAYTFNEMAGRLSDWGNSNLSRIMSEKLRIVAIIEQMRDAIIGINENKEVLFINYAAERILNIPGKSIIGQPIAKYTGSNDLIRSIIEDDVPATPIKITIDGQESYFQQETREIVVPEYDASSDSQELKIASRSVGKVYVLRRVE